jgi:hypothetical protein
MKRLILSSLCFILLIPFLAHGQADIYAVKTPNVMIIFDTSSSMNNAPNGSNPGPGNAKGEDGSTYNFEAGGDHPGSKLYQAKQAMKQILQQVVKDRVNLGFATYAHFKTEKRRGLYQRQRNNYYAATADRWQWRKLYWRYNNYNHGSTRSSNYPDSFVDEWGTTHTGVTVGYTFSRPHWFDNSWSNNKMKVPPPHPPGTYLGDLTYTVTARTVVAEYGYFTFTYWSTSHDHYEETWVYKDGVDPATAPANYCDTLFPKNWPSGGWSTYKSTDAEYIANPAKWACQFWQFIAGSPESWSGWYTEKAWLTFDGTSCPDTYGADNFPPSATQTTKYTRVDNLSDPSLNGTGINCYDASLYSYPADGTANKPHTWTYFNVNAGKWSKPAKNSGYYPSKDGVGNRNNVEGAFDNHYFFINFPDDKEAGFKSSDRTAIKNLILSFLDLTPVKSPETGRYNTKLPNHNTYGRKGLTANTTDSSYTPLADSLLWGNYYFTDYIDNYNGGDLFSKTKIGDIPCRGNYVILLTDGLESSRFDKGLPDYAAAPKEAADLLTIGVKTFVIGFGTNIYGNQALNNIALAGGTQQAYFAADFNQLKTALQNIFQTIANQFYGRSNPVVTKSRDRLFRGAFEIKDGDYYGHLMAWDADKQTGVLAPDFVWDSGEVMNTSGRGSVYTWVASGLNPTIKLFQDSDTTLYPLVNPLGEDINNDGTVNNLDAIGVIKFTLNSNYNDCDEGIIDKVTGNCHGLGYYKGKRPLDWILGDIYHSTPVVIGAPSFFFTENNYQTFYNTYKSREMMIYVGTNEGMLHGFKNTDGSEKFAIIPKSLLGKLKNLSATHEFYVDASPKAYDVYFTAESKWKTVIVSGLRGGGPYYFAVDVTDPDNPKILWEWPNATLDPVNTDPVAAKLGDTWGKPDIGKVKVGGNTKFVAFVTGGYSTLGNRGNSFHIIDIETGCALKSFTVGDSTNKIPSGPTAYDADNNGFVNYVYFGDIQGTLWKVDVSSDVVGNWTLYEFWKDPNFQKRLPIFYAPTVAKNDAGDILIFLGTGDELNLADADKFYAFYEIVDQGATGRDNWTRNLDPGEKVLGSPYVANWVVYFTTWTYTGGAESCGAGEGRLYGLKITKLGAPGASEGLVTLDPVTGKWTAPQNYISLGAGIPSSPLVTNGMIYIGTSLNANRVVQIPIPGWQIARTKSWREVF